MLYVERSTAARSILRTTCTECVRGIAVSETDSPAVETTPNDLFRCATSCLGIFAVRRKKWNGRSKTMCLHLQPHEVSCRDPDVVESGRTVISASLPIKHVRRRMSPFLERCSMRADGEPTVSYCNGSTARCLCPRSVISKVWPHSNITFYQIL